MKVTTSEGDGKEVRYRTDAAVRTPDKFSLSGMSS
jgi:hypothetical protein